MKGRAFCLIGLMVLWIGFKSGSVLGQSSTNYSIRKDVMDQGGSVSSSENYQVTDAIGQPCPIGISASTVYSESSGFFVDEGTGIDAVEENAQPIPTEFALFQNYPNPFNPETEIRFDLPEARDVVIKIYDLLGREIRILIDSHFNAGFHSVVWDGKDERGNSVSSGLYLYRIQAGDFRNVKKMSLIR